MSSYDKVLADYGQQEPITVEVSWNSTVIVHPVSVGAYVDAVTDGEKPVYGMLACSVEVDGEYWTASQWANLPKKAMQDLTAIYDAYKSLNGNDEELEKN